MVFRGGTPLNSHDFQKRKGTNIFSFLFWTLNFLPKALKCAFDQLQQRPVSKLKRHKELEKKYENHYNHILLWRWNTMFYLVQGFPLQENTMCLTWQDVHRIPSAQSKPSCPFRPLFAFWSRYLGHFILGHDAFQNITTTTKAYWAEFQLHLKTNHAFAAESLKHSNPPCSLVQPAKFLIYQTHIATSHLKKT